MRENDLGLQEYDWDDGEIRDTICPFCLDVLPAGDDPTEFFEPTECLHACCWRCSWYNAQEGWSVCPRRAGDCMEHNLLSWDRPTRSWIGNYNKWTVRVAVRDDNKCIGSAESSDGRNARTSTPGCRDEVWAALVKELRTSEPT